MIDMEIARWRVNADPDATKACYARYEMNYEKCDCVYCRNFRAVRDRIFTGKTKELFKTLGIDPNLEATVSHCMLKSGLHLYDFAFHLVGTLISGEDPRQKGDDDFPRIVMVPFDKHLRIGVVDEWTGPMMDSSFEGHPLIHVHFDAEAPWILDEPCPDDQ